MKILVLESSGNKKGSSNMLAGEFIRGAEEAGHEVKEFDVSHSDIRPCLGCNGCYSERCLGVCVQKDDFEPGLKNLVKECDMLVFAMPVYYYNWPAQLKRVIDRFYSFNSEMKDMAKKTVLLTVAADADDDAFAVTIAYYRKLCAYLNFTDLGMVVGKGCGTPELTAASPYPGKAYELGSSLT